MLLLAQGVHSQETNRTALPVATLTCVTKALAVQLLASPFPFEFRSHLQRGLTTDTSSAETVTSEARELQTSLYVKN